MTAAPACMHRVDPGLVRTIMAGRATLGLALAGSALLPLVGMVPLTAAIVGIVVAFLAALLVDDETSSDAVVSCAHVATWSLLLVAVAAVLADHRAAAYVVFVGVMAVATWARGFGERAAAAGTTALVVYLMTTFLQLTLSELPALLLSILVAMVLVAGMSALLARRRCEWRDGQAVRAVLVNGAAVARGARWEKMHEAVQLAWERMGARQGATDVEDDLRSHLARVGLLDEHLRRVHQGVELPLDDPPILEVRRRLREELGGLARTWCRVVGNGTRGFGRVTPPAVEPRSHASRREAVQVAVAGTLAVVAGLWISEERWYWAVIATFVVFVNTGHAGATVRKATERTLGTGVGVVVATWVAATLSGHVSLELIVSFVLVFVGMWVLRASYTLTIGTITVVLALLLDVLGELTPRALVLRFTETAVGAGVGVFVALLILPVRTRVHIAARRQEVLDAVEGVLDRLEAEAYGDGLGRIGLLDALGRVERARAELNAALRTGLRPRGHKDAILTALDALCYWTQRTTWTGLHQGSLACDDVEGLRVRAEALRREIDPPRRPSRLACNSS